MVYENYDNFLRLYSFSCNLDKVTLYKPTNSGNYTEATLKRQARTLNLEQALSITLATNYIERSCRVLCILPFVDKSVFLSCLFHLVLSLALLCVVVSCSSLSYPQW